MGKSLQSPGAAAGAEPRLRRGPPSRAWIWSLAGAGSALVWIVVSILFWLDPSHTLGTRPDLGEAVAFAVFAGLPGVLVGLGTGFVAYAGMRGVRRDARPGRILLGVLQVILAALIWLAAALAVFMWMGLVATG